MKRFGEICRIKYDDKLYILSTSKYTNDDFKSSELYRTWFKLEISTKTAKKNRDKKLNKIDMKYSLIKSKNNPIKLVKELLSYLKLYLDTYKPESLAIAAHGHGLEKRRRFNLYHQIFTSFSYNLDYIEKDDGDEIKIYKRNV